MQKNQSRLDAVTRQLAAEVSKNKIATKRIEQQSERYSYPSPSLLLLLSPSYHCVQTSRSGRATLEDGQGAHQTGSGGGGWQEDSG